jgi:hypothetical protein
LVTLFCFSWCAYGQRTQARDCSEHSLSLQKFKIGLWGHLQELYPREEEPNFSTRTIDKEFANQTLLEVAKRLVGQYSTHELLSLIQESGDSFKLDQLTECSKQAFQKMGNDSLLKNQAINSLLKGQPIVERIASPLFRQPSKQLNSVSEQAATHLVRRENLKLAPKKIFEGRHPDKPACRLSEKLNSSRVDQSSADKRVSDAETFASDRKDLFFAQFIKPNEQKKDSREQRLLAQNLNFKLKLQPKPKIIVESRRWYHSRGGMSTFNIERKKRVATSQVNFLKRRPIKPSGYETRVAGLASEREERKREDMSEEEITDSTLNKMRFVQQAGRHKTPQENIYMNFYTMGELSLLGSDEEDGERDDTYNMHSLSPGTQPDPGQEGGTHLKSTKSLLEREGATSMPPKPADPWEEDGERWGKHIVAFGSPMHSH